MNAREMALNGVKECIEAREDFKAEQVAHAARRKAQMERIARGVEIGFIAVAMGR